MPKRAMEPYGRFTKEATWACPQDDGEVSAALQTLCSTEEDSRCIACQDEAQSPKKKLLMYAGDFLEDDTEAFLGLAENLDFQKYDVTLLVCGGGDDFAEEQIIGLPAGLRILYRGQPFNGKAEEIAQNELFLKGKIKDIPHAFYKREARRLFGEAKFDCAIDLTGKKSLFSVVAKEMDGVRFFQYNARFVREKQIAKAGRPAGNRICHRKLLYCQIPGKQSSCYYRGSHSGTGYRESQLYLYVPAKSPERSESFLPSGEKYLSLHYRKRERVSEAESYGFRSSPGGKGDPYRMA